MILNTKPLNHECLIQVILSQTENEGNRLAHSYSKFRTSVHFSFDGGENLFLLSQCQHLDLMSCQDILHCSQHISSLLAPYFDSLLFYFQVPFIISPQFNHPTLFATIHLPGPCLLARSGSLWPCIQAPSFLSFSSLLMLFPCLQCHHASLHIYINI